MVQTKRCHSWNDNQQAPPPPPTEAEIDYLRKSDYGQVPAYLATVKVGELN